MTAVRPARPDRLMLYSLDLQVDLPAWFDELDVSPSKSTLDAWRWAFRRFGSGTFSARSIGKDFGWTLASYARAKVGLDRLGKQRLIGEAWPSLETLAESMGVNRRSLTNAAAAGDEAGWWIYQPGNKNKDTRFYLSLPKERPADVKPIERPDRRGQMQGLINGADHVLINGAEVLDNADTRLDQWHKPEENPKSETESETAESSSSLASLTRSGQIRIEYVFGAETGSQRDVPPETAKKLIERRHAVEVAA